MEKENNILYLLLNSFILAFKEWKYLLGFVIIGSLNLYMVMIDTINSFISYLGLEMGWIILYVLTQLLLLTGMHALLGRLARKIYHMEGISIIEIIKRSLYSSLIVVVFVSVWYALNRGIFVLFNDITLSSVVLSLMLSLLSVLLITSLILENIKAFFLEKEVFSLYNVLVRIVDIRFISAVVITSIVAIIVYYFSNVLGELLLSFITNIWLYSFALSFLIGGLIYGYITFAILIFFLQAFNLDDE